MENKIFWRTPTDAEIIKEFEEIQMCKKWGEIEEAQRLTNIVMQAMISRDRDQRVRDSLICVSFN